MSAEAGSRRLPAGALICFARSAFECVGMRSADAQIMAASLVEADVMGVSTHGLNRLESYLGQLRAGQVEVRPIEATVKEGPASVLIDAGGGLGAPVGIRTVEALISKARSCGVALGAVRKVAHFGAAGFYTRHAARSGFLAVAASSSSASVVPFGGRGPRIGNSPISFATPGVEHPELVMDMALSTTSRGRIKLAADKGEDLPEGWAVDSSGAPTTDPEAALAGGVLPSGGHKGSALSLMVEMLASGLAGANLTQQINHAGFTSAAGREASSTLDVTVGNFYLVIDADLFGDGTGVRERATAIANHVRASEPALHVDQVLAPGDIEAARAEQASHEGVSLSERTLQSLARVAGQLGIDFHPDDPRVEE
ncbi:MULTISPECIES: Ldh family oxidoreductase [Streptomyces violaceusniger group]|uniref:Ldh family oxidoreductase n=2 Tax=Streptomyces javensis TaxID=114698 RepID=A0ABN1WFC6_9ACTN|nr:Ldh family oxidoreductase [Streptomyces javensis]MBI0312306.1 Ldh family oxidoreductase [Streptomyces javensis]